MLYGRYWKPTDETDVAKILKRVEAMTFTECLAFIKTAEQAQCDLYARPWGSKMLTPLEKEARIHEEYAPFYQAMTDPDCDLTSIKQVISGEMIAMMFQEYGTNYYDDRRVLMAYVEDETKNITQWPAIRYACEWHPRHTELVKIRNRVEEESWDNA